MRPKTLGIRPRGQRRSLLSVCVVVAAQILAGGGCKRGSTVAASPRPVDCSSSATSEPLLIAWEPESRTTLDKLRRQGVVAVRYEVKGCDVSLELLPQCIGPKNRYVYSPLDTSETQVSRDAADLFSKWPLGASNAKTLLDDKPAVRADLAVVGAVALPEGSTITEYDLVGVECRRATHVVSTLYVGGFAMAPTDLSEATSRAETANLFVGARRPGIVREGDAAICARAAAEKTELPGCSVPLRVTLLPLQGASSPSRCLTGYAFDGERCVRAEAKAPAACADCPDAGESTDLPDVFDQSTVERLVRQRQPSVKRICWDAAPATLKRITVNVTTRIDRRGVVTEADGQVTDSEGPPDVANVVGRCIANEIHGWRFPEPEAEKVLVLPFHLIRQ